MGLDMYLYKKHYIGNKYRDADKQVKVVVPADQQGVTFKTTPINDARITEISEEVAYWRKANAIHQWFVTNVQEGEDDCKEYYVGREQLEDLLKLCNTVLAASFLVDGKIKNGETLKDGQWVPIIVDGQKVADSTTAEILLPTSKGFFFGSQEYDQYYVDDLKETVEQLTKVLAEGDGGEFYYSSSW